MMTSSKEENNVKKENTRSRRSTVQNKEVETKETRQEKLTKKPETQDDKIKKKEAASEKQEEKHAGTPIRSSRTTPRKSIALTPVKENVPIAMDKNTVEISSVTKEHKEQGTSHSDSDKAITEKKEKTEQKEMSLKDETHKTEKEKVIYENILTKKLALMDEADRKKEESVTECESALLAGTPVQKTRRTIRISVGVTTFKENVQQLIKMRTLFMRYPRLSKKVKIKG